MSVKEKRRGRPQGDKRQLSEQVILTQAKALMTGDGKMPSIRKLAGQLGVDAMAIYYYFANKDALQEAIAVSLIEEIYQPNLADPWRDELTALCQSYVLLLHRHSGLLETLLKMKSDSPAMVFIERFNAILEPLKIDSAKSTNAIHLLADYLHGFVLALNCQPDSELNIEMLNGPLEFYYSTLQS